MSLEVFAANHSVVEDINEFRNGDISKVSPSRTLNGHVEVWEKFDRGCV